MKLPEMTKLAGSGVAEAMDATDSIPSFMIESLIGVYMKGLGFVFAVHERGWSEVEKLYTEYPPQSTEQILHPEKWQSREAPSEITYPALEKVSALKNWEPLDSDVLGEFQWRVIFKEQGLGAEAEAAAAGWDGDRYIIFKRKDSDATLMLLSTSWDSAAQAEEFASAYRRLLARKYQGAPEPSRVLQKKENVYIVEGGNEKDIGALLKGVGMTLVSKVGGAAGPLYGTLFLQMGTASAGQAELDLAGWAEALETGVKGVQARGKAELGDKTMIDALNPAVEALRAAADEGADLGDALRRSADAAAEGMRATTELEARRGRASYLGPRSVGHQDPGATSSQLLLEVAATTFGSDG